MVFSKEQERSASAEIDAAVIHVENDIESLLPNNTILCVLDFSTPSADMSEYLREQLTSMLTEQARFRIVTRHEMAVIDKELKYQMSEMVSDETALSICERLGAQVIVLGQMTELDNSYLLRIKVLGVEKGTYLLYKSYTVTRSSKTEQLMGRAAVYRKSAFGLSAEANKNSVMYIAPAGGFTFDYNFTRSFSAGIKVLLSADVLNTNSIIYTFEPAALMRYYVVSPSGEPSSGVFVQGEGGLELIFVNSLMMYTPSGGLCIGFRKSFNTCYIEPELRGGYPYLFGAGLTFGMRF